MKEICIGRSVSLTLHVLQMVWCNNKAYTERRRAPIYPLEDLLVSETKHRTFLAPGIEVSWSG